MGANILPGRTAVSLVSLGRVSANRTVGGVKETIKRSGETKMATKIEQAKYKDNIEAYARVKMDSNK